MHVDELLRDVAARVHLARVRRKRAQVLVLAAVGREGVVALRVSREGRVVPARGKRHGRARLPAADEAGARQLDGVGGGVDDEWGGGRDAAEKGD